VLFVLLIFGVVNISWRNTCFIFCETEEDNTLRLRKLNQPFNWDGEERNQEQNNSSTEYRPSTCRNSMQGKYIVTDDKGFVCKRENIQGNGCCDKINNLGRYSCQDCDTNTQCCQEYEFCISCCLRKEQRPELQDFLKQAAENNNVLFVSVSDHFELCLAKCRTSSTSVKHENTYRNKKKKYCYGKNLSPLLNSADESE